MNFTHNFLDLLKRYTYFPRNVVGLGKKWMRLVGIQMEEGRGFRKKSFSNEKPMSASKLRAKAIKLAQKRRRARHVRKYNQRFQVRYHG